MGLTFYGIIDHVNHIKILTGLVGFEKIYSNRNVIRAGPNTMYD